MKSDRKGHPKCHFQENNKNVNIFFKLRDVCKYLDAHQKLIQAYAAFEQPTQKTFQGHLIFINKLPPSIQKLKGKLTLKMFAGRKDKINPGTALGDTTISPCVM